MPSEAPTPLPSPLPTLLPTPTPSQTPTMLPTPLPSLPPTPLPSGAPSPAPSGTPSPAPTTVLRGYQKCLCFSANAVAKLKVHCPEVATHFAADSCMYNMTSAELQVLAIDCEALKSGYFSSKLR